MPRSQFAEAFSELHGITYYTLIPSETDLHPPALENRDIASFLTGEMEVSRRVTGIFSKDLTDRDDVIVAILSLLLVLAIEGVVTAVLLQTRNGTASTFGFSINQLSNLTREFKLMPFFRLNSKRTLHFRLVLLALLVFTVSFGLEVLVLFLTNPEKREVLNDVATFRIADPVRPEFDPIFAAAETKINPPCVAVSLEGVVQNSTRIGACMNSDLSTNTIANFERATEEIDVKLTSDLHEFGSDHHIDFGGKAASYSARAYFNLGRYETISTRGNNLRLMRKSDMSAPRERTIAAVHKQFIAYLFTEYRNKVGDVDMNLDRLNNIDFRFEPSNGPTVDIIVINDGKRILQRPSRRYTTSFRAVVPGGEAALRFAEPFLKASIAVTIAGPNERDLMANSGSTTGTKGVVWLEEFRVLNWLSLSIILAFVLTVLVLLRCSLKPVVMAEMAGLYVAETLGTPADVAPIDLMARDDHFDIPFRSGTLAARQEWDDNESRARRRYAMGLGRVSEV